MVSIALPTISILAANSQQSSSIITHLLSLGDVFSTRFRLRAIVRNPSKYTPPQPSGSNAEQPGNPDEVVQGDMTSVESLKQAFKGSSVVWAMTNAVPNEGPEAELQMGKNIVDAFLAATDGQGTIAPEKKPLLVLSSAIDAHALTQGKIKMINAVGKAWIESYVHELPSEVQSRFRFTVVHAGMFMQNFLSYQRPTTDDDGIYHFRAAVRPDVQIPFVDITDLGPLLWQLLDSAFPTDGQSDRYDQYDRATIRLVGEYLSYPQLVSLFTQASGKAAVYDYLKLNQFLAESFGQTASDVQSQFEARDAGTGPETVATMIGDMYNFINGYGYYADPTNGSDDDPRTKKIILQQSTRKTTWAQFVQKHFSGTTEDIAGAGADAGAGSVSSKVQLPTGLKADTQLSPAEQFLKGLATYFVDGSSPTPFAEGDYPNDLRDLIVKPWYDLNATVELPYSPRAMRDAMKLRPTVDSDEDGIRLEGQDEITAYFGGWRKWIWFNRGEIKSLAALSTVATTETSHLMSSATAGAVMEMKLYGKVLQGEEKPYVQDYVCFAYTNAEGKVVLYKEYWSPTRM